MITGKKKGLGRGLSALFGDQSPKKESKEKQSLAKISLTDLSRNPFQPRIIFNEAKLVELSNSIISNFFLIKFIKGINKNLCRPFLYKSDGL